MRKSCFAGIFFIIIIILFSISLLADNTKSGLVFSPFPGINYPFEIENITCAIGIFGLVLPSYHGFASSLIYNTIKDYSEGFGFALLYQSYLNGFSGYLITFGSNFVSGNFKGLEFSFIANLNLGEFSGIQAAMLNFASSRFNGLQIGFLNLDYGEFSGYRLGLVSLSKNFNGYLDISIFASFNSSDFTGFQASIFNLNLGNFKGFQIGILNFDLKDFDGIRIGIASFARNFNGFQIGILNFSNDFDGIQIGIINIAKYENGYSFGLINIFLKGYNAIETSLNELGIMKINLKWGSKKFYSIFGYGMDSSQTIFQSTLGFGSHLDLIYSVFFFDIEFFIQGLSRFENMQKYLSNPTILYGSEDYSYYEFNDEIYYYHEVTIPYTICYLILGDYSSLSLRFNFGINLGLLQVIFGITYNLGFMLNPETAVFSWYLPSNINPILNEANNFKFFQYGWFGFTLGVQFKL